MRRNVAALRALSKIWVPLLLSTFLATPPAQRAAVEEALSAYACVCEPAAAATFFRAVVTKLVKASGCSLLQPRVRVGWKRLCRCRRRCSCWRAVCTPRFPATPLDTPPPGTRLPAGHAAGGQRRAGAGRGAGGRRRRHAAALRLFGAGAQPGGRAGAAGARRAARRGQARAHGGRAAACPSGPRLQAGGVPWSPAVCWVAATPRPSSHLIPQPTHVCRAPQEREAAVQKRAYKALAYLCEARPDWLEPRFQQVRGRGLSGRLGGWGAQHRR